MLAIEISPDMEEMFRSVSLATGRSLSELVQEAMDRFLEDWEDLQDAQEAGKVLEEYRRDPARAWSTDDVLNLCGLVRDDIA
ncbi:MAG: hypothetical protein G8237_14015 [Magnetococcales bacterium]|nr:hypothetical protein [Magnetococcales bacterium]NGZ07458.1 hypothetical protein [Magnetococcales bacterium]